MVQSQDVIYLPVLSPHIPVFTTCRSSATPKTSVMLQTAASRLIDTQPLRQLVAGGVMGMLLFTICTSSERLTLSLFHTDHLPFTDMGLPLLANTPVDSAKDQSKEAGEVDPDCVVIRHAPVLPAVTQ